MACACAALLWCLVCVFVCAEGLRLASEGGPSHVACFGAVPFAALSVDRFDKLYATFIYDVVVLRFWRHVAGVCGCMKY